MILEDPNRRPLAIGLAIESVRKERSEEMTAGSVNPTHTPHQPQERLRHNTVICICDNLGQPAPLPLVDVGIKRQSRRLCRASAAEEAHLQQNRHLMEGDDAPPHKRQLAV